MPKFRPLPPLERLNELLEVVEIPEDKFGEWSGLVWKVSRGGKANAGSVVGWPNLNSKSSDRFDWRVRVDGVCYLASRVIYFMTHGEDPGDVQVDHEDRNWLNNNVSNLRLDVGGVQQANRSMLQTNTSGVTGVYWNKEARRWRAYARVEDKPKHLGSFTCKIEAARVVNEKWIELGWIEKGRKLNDLEIIECDCESCMSCAPRSGTTVESHPLVESRV